MEWTSDKVDFLKEFIPGHTEEEIRTAFAEKFGIVLKESQIGNFKTKHKVKSGTHGGQFKKGHPAPNKGKRLEDFVSPEGIERMKATQFKKGNMPHTWVPIGTERETPDGYVEVKVRDRPSNPLSNDNWELKQRHIYEQHHGKLAKNEVVVFADKNRRNFDIDNLVAVNRSLMTTINHEGYTYCDRESLEVAIATAKLKSVVYQIGLRERECRVCGRMYKPHFANSKTCPECLKEGRRGR